MATKISETKRLILRRFQSTDVDDLTEALEHPEVMEFSLSGSINRTAVAKTIRNFETSKHTGRPGVLGNVQLFIRQIKK